MHVCVCVYVFMCVWVYMCVFVCMYMCLGQCCVVFVFVFVSVSASVSGSFGLCVMSLIMFQYGKCHDTRAAYTSNTQIIRKDIMKRAIKQIH